MAKKQSRRMSKKNRTQRKRTQRGGNSTPAPVSGNAMGEMMKQSLSQGQQFANIHAKQHGGGGLDAGPFPGAVTEQALIPSNLMAAARVAPLNAALNAIANMKDPGQAGGARKHKASRKSRKASKKSRKASKKSRKASKKSRKSMKKGRKMTKKMRGGAAYDSNPQPLSASSMLLPPSLEAKVLSGMNPEWKLAENPNAFAPGYKSY